MSITVGGCIQWVGVYYSGSVPTISSNNYFL